MTNKSESLIRYQSKHIVMYSPKIDKHTPNLYRLAKVVGKPMTQVADDLIAYGFKNLKLIYNLDDEHIAMILKENQEK